jgi:hypothetical protein
MLRTIEETKLRSNLFTILVRTGQILHQSSHCRSRETQKARKDTIPRERGPLPVLPSEFFCVALADPKARFCRSLASHSSTVNRIPSYPIDP